MESQEEQQGEVESKEEQQGEVESQEEQQGEVETNYYYKAFIPRHSSGLKTCSEALTRHSVDKRKHKNK